MITQIMEGNRWEVMSMISLSTHVHLTGDEAEKMEFCLQNSADIWYAIVEDRLAAAWGLIPPSLMSQQAYLWLYTTKMVEGHEFTLVRQSQIAIAKMLEKYPTIVGHTDIAKVRGIRWLKWLGAKYGEPDGQLMPFTIVRNHG